MIESDVKPGGIYSQNKKENNETEKSKIEGKNSKSYKSQTELNRKKSMEKCAQ
jgi:hypothetical protein